jgi:beta-lactamase class A
MRRVLVAVAVLVSCGALAQPAAQPQPPAPATGLARLRANIEQITSSVGTHWGIYMKCLDTNEEIAINADEPMDTMSVIKVPLMVEAFRQIGEGKFSLADRYTLKTADKRPGTGVIRSFDEGASLTVKDLLTLMIIVSDNTATDVMFSKVGGPPAVTALMQQYGLASIRATGFADDWFKALTAAGSPVKFHAARQHPFGLSSPRDMGRLLEKIAAGQAVSKQASDEMIDIMRGQLYRTRLPKYVSGFQLPHKTGDFVPWIANDVGLLINNQHKIVICVFTDKSDLAEGEPTALIGAAIEDAIGRVGQQVADYYGFK